MTTTTTSTRDVQGAARPFALTFLVGAAALTITLAGVKSIADIIGPIFLAVVITITLHPIRLWLERHRVHELAASIVMLLAAILLLGLLTLTLIVSVAQLAALMPQYTDEINDAVQNAANTLRDLGVKQDQIDAVSNSVDPGKVVDLAMTLLSNTLAVVSNLVFLISVLLFLAFDTDSTRRSLAKVGESFPNPVAAIGDFALGARNYMGVSASFGLVVAILDGLVLWVLDVPGAFVWAVLAFVTNFIPNIGFIIGVIPPALFALLEDGPGLMITVIVAYSVINFVIQSVIQPRVVGDRVGLTPTITFLSLVFWTWIVGPLGALLAVPLTLFAGALLVEADPRTRWAIPLLSGTPEEVPGTPAEGGDPESKDAPAAPLQGEASG